MNRLTVLLGIAALGLILAFFFGKWMILGDLENRIVDETMKSQQAEANTKALTLQLDTLKAQIANVPVRVAPKFLAAGSEGALLRRIFDAASQSQLILKELGFMKTFYIKGKQEEDAPPRQGFNTAEQLPQIDERTGMPIGAKIEEAETDWPGVEVIPARLQIKGTFRGIVAFFNVLRKTAPMFQVRSTDFALEESGIVNGTAILVFPVFEPTMAPPPAAE
ncbi:hypothetical protein AUK22_09690 [bacterium CG2_30_54_10]|nr:MAG: hypothetical protein AUK22_09690 [bacterium CG2_30_54_10]